MSSLPVSSFVAKCVLFGSGYRGVICCAVGIEVSVVQWGFWGALFCCAVGILGCIVLFCSGYCDVHCFVL